MEQIEMNISRKNSLIHLGSLDSFDITEGGKKAAKCILEFLGNGDENRLRKAIDIYEELIPNENFGGEYTALEWLCRLWIAPEDKRDELLANLPVAGFYELLSADDFENLKWYINRKYHFIEIDRKDSESKDRLRFLEDFILFGNPDRERWERVKESLSGLPVREGMSIADVGAGPGFYSFKFADLVGKDGKVYAIETNPRHLEYLRDYISKNGIGNVEAVTGSFQGIGLREGIEVDMVFICSLYHNVYAAFTDDERDEFVGSIRRALKTGGTLVIVDNDLVEEDEMPYHGPYIAKELLLGQLYYYGFTLRKQYQFTPQRYVLVLDKQEQLPPEDRQVHATFTDETRRFLRVTGTASLVRYRIIGTSTSGYTWNGKRIARMLYEGLTEQDTEGIARAGAEYERFMGRERIGDDYTALLWFCRMYLMSGEEREKCLEDRLVRDYYVFFSEEDYRVLKAYLWNKYNLRAPLPEAETPGTMEIQETDVSLGQLNEWSEYLTFNNPNRHLWEKTGEMLDYMEIAKGDTVADIGCGSGYFSWQFSKRVGSAGKVYATEVNKDALAYVERLADEEDTCIVPVVAALNNVGLEENTVDVMFMCSMYHAVYIASIEFVKDDFLKSVRKCLKPGGLLYVADNDIVPKKEAAYFGPGIVKELVIAQLTQYGFELEDFKQFVPQRYVLRFRLGGKEKCI